MAQTLPAPALPGRPPDGVWRRAWRGRLGYLFVLPTFAFLAYFSYYPAYVALTGAFTNWDGFNEPQFTGLANLQRAFADPVLAVASRNNLIWVFWGVILALLPPLVVAELIFHLRTRTRQYAYRTLFVAPIIIPSLVSLLLWTFFYRGDGLINQLLDSTGLGSLKHLWLADPKIALYSLIFMGFPWINSFNLLILYSGLQSIPGEVLEAAKLDGAAGLRRVLSIDLPLLAPQMRLLLVLAIIANVQNLVSPLVMTGGGPGSSTTVPALHMYKRAIDFGEFGYSMAISFLLFVVVILLTLLSRRLSRER